MSNRCVASGCGNMPSDSVSLFRFPKAPNLCGVLTRQVERTRVDCFDKKAIYALLYKVTVS